MEHCPLYRQFKFTKMNHTECHLQHKNMVKKSSSNNKVEVYLENQDIVDQIDGVVLVGQEELQTRKVFAIVLAVLSYCCPELDALGYAIQELAYLSKFQVFPNEAEVNARPLTPLQASLVHKFGSDAHPFQLELEPHSPASVRLQLETCAKHKPCGVDYELRLFLADELDEKGIATLETDPNAVCLALKKVALASAALLVQPSLKVGKRFLFSSRKLFLEVTLDRDTYYHGEDIVVSVHIANNSNRSVKRIKISVQQVVGFRFILYAQHKFIVAQIEAKDGFPLAPGTDTFQVYRLKPLLADNRDKLGLAIDGQLNEERATLASSTIIDGSVKKNKSGILVKYNVQVKLCTGPFASHVLAELPFKLTHLMPEPIQEIE